MVHPGRGRTVLLPSHQLTCGSGQLSAFSPGCSHTEPCRRLATLPQAALPRPRLLLASSTWQEAKLGAASGWAPGPDFCFCQPNFFQKASSDP